MLRFIFLAICTVAFSQCALGEWRWKDKVAVVTGASSGIGAEIALQLANNGMVVVALARREHRLQELVEKTTGKIHPLKCDIQNEEEIINAFQWVENTLGGVDVLINNAGVFSSDSLSTGDTHKWKRMIDVNLLGTTICSREALKTMRKRGDDGQIININSLAGHNVLHFPNVGNGIYTATKYAVTAVSEALSNELSDAGSSIKVTSLSPGLVMTEIISNQTTATDKSFHDAMSKINYINADDIAEGVMYILSTKPRVHTLHDINQLDCGKNGGIKSGENITFIKYKLPD